MATAKRPQYFYVYDHSPQRGEQYSHPVVRIFRIDPQYRSCHDLVGTYNFQCDDRRGFGARQAYGLSLELTSNHYSQEALKIAAKVFEICQWHDRPVIGLIKLLRRTFKARRYVLAQTGDNALQRDFIPRPWKEDGKLYKEALQKGFSLQRKSRR